MTTPYVSVNMHNPQVGAVYRVLGDGDEPGTVVARLGDGTSVGGRATVTLFLGSDPDHVQGFIDQLAQGYRDLLAWEADGRCQRCDVPDAEYPLCVNCQP